MKKLISLLTEVVEGNEKEYKLKSQEANIVKSLIPKKEFNKSQNLLNQEGKREQQTHDELLQLITILRIDFVRDKH